MRPRSTWAVGLLAAASFTTAAPPAWNGTVRVDGMLRAMMHEGRTGAAVTLDALLPDATLYGLGAQAALAGEVTIVAGTAYLSSAAGEGTRTEATANPTTGAALLVSAQVAGWRDMRLDQPVTFADLDDAIARLGREAGFAPDARFPFLVEGRVEQLTWHVIDGTRLPPGPSTPQAHHDAAVRERRDATKATLIGFYSAGDAGIFTHMGSRTHVHCVLTEPLAAGHVENVVLPAGTVVRLPAGAG